MPENFDQRILRERREIMALREDAGRLETKAAELRRLAGERERQLDNAITANMLGR